MMVVGSMMNNVQRALMKSKYIFGGLLILTKFFHGVKRALVLKIDIEKSFDCMNSGYLDNTFKVMGFEEKWRRWIQTCLKLDIRSVLVNEIPMCKFKMTIGLRQGTLSLNSHTYW